MNEALSFYDKLDLLTPLKISFPHFGPFCYNHKKTLLVVAGISSCDRQAKLP